MIRNQNRSQPFGRSNVKKAQATATPTSYKTNDINEHFGNIDTTDPMAKPTSILKKKKQDRSHIDRFNETVQDWEQPKNFNFPSMKSNYSPVATPPKLRSMISPPGGLEPYRNAYNLRRQNSPLPALDDWYSPPVGLETWGIDPIDYRLNRDLNLYRRYPSPLNHYGLKTTRQRQKKSYIVVPNLSNISTPPISRDGIGGTFITGNRGRGTTYVPDPQYAYLERIRSYPSPKFQREPSDYLYIRRNEGLLNRFVEDFIQKCIEDQFVPDILLEIIGELDRENKNKGEKSYKPEVDRYFTELNNLISRNEANDTHLFSDDWIRELDYQRPPIPRSNITPRLPLLRPIDIEEIQPVRSKISKRTTYQNLPVQTQNQILSDMNQELIDFEVKNLVTEVTGQTITNKINNVPMMNDATNHIYRNVETEVIKELMRDTAYEVTNSQRTRIDQVQFKSVERHAENKLLDTIYLDQLIATYLRQTGSIVDVDDLSRFLDATILENLIYHYQNIDEYRSRTIDNYAFRKLHLNTFMNITMDTLLTELSASLIEDMKDLNQQERGIF